VSGHYQGLGGASAVATEALLDARELIGGVSDAQAMGAIYGPAGTGKSFAVTEVLTDRAERDWVHTEFRCRRTLRYVRQELARLLGIPEAGRLGPFETDWSLKHALSGAFQLLVIDEAQWLNRECFEYLRHLYDDPDTHFALLFVGGDGCYEVLRREPMLDSRLYAHQRFTALTQAEVLTVIPGYHPIYTDADPTVLRLVDEVWVIVARCPPGPRSTAPTSSALELETAKSPSSAGRTPSASSTRRSASEAVLAPDRASEAARSTLVCASTRSRTDAVLIPTQRPPWVSTSAVSFPSVRDAGARSTNSSTTWPVSSSAADSPATGSTATERRLHPCRPRWAAKATNVPGSSAKRARTRHVRPASGTSSHSMRPGSARPIAATSAQDVRRVTIGRPVRGWADALGGRQLRLAVGDGSD